MFLLIDILKSYSMFIHVYKNNTFPNVSVKNFYFCDTKRSLFVTIQLNNIFVLNSFKVRESIVFLTRSSMFGIRLSVNVFFSFYQIPNTELRIPDCQIKPCRHLVFIN